MRLELRGITKRFGALVANNAIDLVVEPGEVHALLGENGAGKSTLMNILSGLHRPDDGQILLDSVPVQFTGPGDAIRAGIGMVHQHFMLIPVFTVTENIMLGRENARRFGVLDRRSARQRVRDISTRYGLDVPPDAKVGDLPVGVQQRVEIIKALTRDASILILDEPTAVLTPQETDELIKVIHALRDAGTSVIFISHKLREARDAADRITVIRRGTTVGTVAPTTAAAELAAMMVGRQVQLRVDKPPARPAQSVLQVEGLSVVDSAGVAVVDQVSFEVRAGEIYALAGVQGNGQTELTETIVGLRDTYQGEIRIAGQRTTTMSTQQILALGVGYVPEDRLHDGVIGSFTIEDNLILDQFRRPPVAQRFFLNRRAIRQNGRRRIEEFDVRTSSATAPISTLSGGNQQKVVLAREMSRPLKLLIVAQPTRGLDVGSMEFVHRRIVAERDHGTAVLLISTELDEILGLADRIAVMFRGRIIGEVSAYVAAERIGLLMAGDREGSSKRTGEVA